MISIHYIGLCLIMGLVNCQLTSQVFTCSHTMTLQQIIILLKQTPCVPIFENITHQHRQKRNTDAGNLNIHALQTTINDHRTMINYLINNSINATFVADAINDHHTKTGPILSSWRDIVAIFTITSFIGIFVYFCVFRSGFNLCDWLISCFCQRIINRAQQQQQQQQSVTPSNRKSSIKQQRQPKTPLQSSLQSLEGEITRINHGYMSA
ncbi:hypothetical protein I4U23_017157 [Adineta vaga]|nr:hypothetical protein I4U23_017157 [Adineta vaga]